jgi:ABC-type transporter Mla MlaB component
MPFSIATHPGGDVLALEGAVTVRDVRDLAASLAERLDGSRPLTVDASALEDVDTCVLQLLCSLRRTASAFTVDRASPRFTAAAERAGLRRELLGPQGAQ